MTRHARIPIGMLCGALFVAAPSVTRAAIIDFTTPDFVGAQFCLAGPGGPSKATGIMDMYQELGVRVRIESEAEPPFYHRTCDPTVQLAGFSAVTDLVERPIAPVGFPIWGMDDGVLNVTSLNGDRIYGIKASLFDQQQACGTATIQGISAGSPFVLPLCPVFDGWILFADHGLNGVTSFSVRFPLVVPWLDPRFVLNAIEVPEPGVLALVSVGLITLSRRLGIVCRSPACCRRTAATLRAKGYSDSSISTRSESETR